MPPPPLLRPVESDVPVLTAAPPHPPPPPSPPPACAVLRSHDDDDDGTHTQPATVTHQSPHRPALRTIVRPARRLVRRRSHHRLFSSLSFPLLLSPTTTLFSCTCTCTTLPHCCPPARRRSSPSCTSGTATSKHTSAPAGVHGEGALSSPGPASHGALLLILGCACAYLSSSRAPD